MANFGYTKMAGAIFMESMVSAVMKLTRRNFRMQCAK